MPRSKSKKQQRRQKVEAKRRRQRHRQSPAGIVARALLQPICECWINASWRDPQALTQISVARPLDGRGTLAFMTVLVDRMCLGAKAGYLRTGSTTDYKLHLDRMREGQPMERCEPTLAAKVLHAGLVYAQRLGFGPDADAEEGFGLLADADPEDCSETVEVGGPEGKPLYIAGPHDNIVHIMTRLRTRLGSDGFHYVLPGELMEEGRGHHWLEGVEGTAPPDTDA